MPHRQVPHTASPKAQRNCSAQTEEEAGSREEAVKGSQRPEQSPALHNQEGGQASRGCSFGERLTSLAPALLSAPVQDTGLL